jgi:hypothetical protein
MNIRRNDEAMKHFVHLVVGLVIYERVENGRLGNWFASGFPIQVGADAWLATAGHVVNELRRIMANGSFDRLYVVDSWVGPNGTGLPFRTRVAPDDLFVVGENADEVDLGAIKLDSLAVEALKRSNTGFVTESDWAAPGRRTGTRSLRYTISLFDSPFSLPRRGPAGEAGPAQGGRRGSSGRYTGPHSTQPAAAMESDHMKKYRLEEIASSAIRSAEQALR